MNVIQERLTALRSKMQEHDINYYVVPTADFHQSEYVGEHFKARKFITGFSGSAGVAVVGLDGAWLWVDGRYFLQAGEQLQGTTVELMKMGEPGVPTLDAFINSNLKKGEKIGFDGRVVSMDEGQLYDEIAKKHEGCIEYSVDLIDEIWTDRPPLSEKPAFDLDVKYTGKTVAEKLADIREKMVEAEADMHVVTTLDDICWTLNIRGDDIDFFPLSVDYEEKLYSVGKIPGSYNRREGKPADSAVLISRAIDRPIRPLFPSDFRNNVVIVNTVLSDDQENSPEVCAQIGTSAALAISDIPWGGPSAAVAVGYVDDQIIINPNCEQRAKSRMKATVAGTKEKITMIEAGADNISNEIMLEAIKAAHVEIKKMCEFIQTMRDEIGKPKFEYKSFSVNPEYFERVCNELTEEMTNAVKETDKVTRNANVDKVSEKIKNIAIEMFGENAEEEHKFDIATAIHDLQKKCVRSIILNEHIRPDGREINEVRKLTAEVDLIPRVHGSGLF